MIKVIIGNNVNRQEVICNENTTLRECLESNQIDYTVGTTHLDGASLRAGDLDKSFKDMGVTERCYLLNIVKADNA